jgi:DNA end-binding protein Ku
MKFEQWRNRDNLLAMIEAKKAGQEIIETPAAPTAKVVDILEALKKSLELAKKPPMSELASASAPRKRTTTRKAAGG